MVRGIRRDCVGRTIVHSVFPSCRRKPIQVYPNRRTLIKHSEGKRIVDIRRLAKRVVLELNSGNRIVVEPRMTGLLLLADPPTVEHRRVCFELSPDRNESPVLEFWDRRGLGTVSLLKPTEFELLERRLGKDALTASLDEWASFLEKTQREIKVVLLDQSLICGIGNLYASEILHEASISPFRAAASLSAKSIVRLVNATQRILVEAIKYEGSTLGDGTYRNALNKNGKYQNHHRVYKRADTRCPTCKKADIVRTVQAQRSTFYCPGCQR